MKKLALLLSLLALGALGLAACGGGDDEGSATAAKVSADTTTEAKLPREQVQELKRKGFANIKAKLSREQVQELKRAASDWASLFATNACNRYMGQPMCQRLECVRHFVPIENCKPVSAAFQKSFADATVEDIRSERIRPSRTDRPYYEAAVKFSNGEVVVFGGVRGPEPPAGSCAGAGPGFECAWNPAEPVHNRRFLDAAAPREA